jgi:hypothetical protein
MLQDIIKWPISAALKIQKWAIAERVGLPFMFKYWPGKTHNSRTVLLEGQIWAEYPESLLVNVNWDSYPPKVL